MNTIAKCSVDIDNNIDEVFAYVTNMENFGKWFPKVSQMRPASNQNSELVGRRYVETVKVPTQGEKEVIIEVVEHIKNEKFVTEGNISPLLPKMTVLFAKLEDNKSSVQWKMQSRNESALFKLTFLPLIKFLMQKRAKQGLANLKIILDGNNSAP